MTTESNDIDQRLAEIRQRICAEKRHLEKFRRERASTTERLDEAIRQSTYTLKRLNAEYCALQRDLRRPPLRTRPPRLRSKVHGGVISTIEDQATANRREE